MDFCKSSEENKACINANYGLSIEKDQGLETRIGSRRRIMKPNIYTTVLLGTQRGEIYLNFARDVSAMTKKYIPYAKFCIKTQLAVEL